MAILRLLFSPFGCVGRSTWWMTQIVCSILHVSMVLYIFSIAALTPGDFGDAPAALRAKKTLTAADMKAAQAMIQKIVTTKLVPKANQLAFLAFLFLLSLYSSLVIGIKRWHDRGMSGFCYLFGCVPTVLNLLHFPLFGLLLSLIIGIWMLVQLGFLGSVYAPEEQYQPTPSSGSSVWLTVAAFVLGGVLLLFLMGFFAESELLHQKTRPKPSDEPQADAPASVNPAPQSSPQPLAESTPPEPPPEPLPESAFHGTLATNFGKNWIVVDGEVLGAITAANPAPDGQVAILYSDGGRNLPASSLPQGFLDAWNLTPQRLKAANSQ